MGQKEKLIKRLKTKPRDFTFDEAETLLGYLTYSRSNKGKTSGSRALFVKGENTYAVHKPHPGNIVKGYVLKQVYEYLKKLDLLK